MIGVTPADPPLFSDLSKAALEQHSDVVLIRAGLAPEFDNPVTVDVAIRTPAEVITFSQYHFVERANGSLWLCAERSEGPAMEVSSRGLALHIRQPFSEEERVDGACRAAAQIVRLSRGTI